MKAEREIPDEPVEVAEDLVESYKHLDAIIRGNNKLDKRLTNQYGRELDAGIFVLHRLDLFIETLLGKTEESKLRIEFETKYAEALRDMMNKALEEAQRMEFQDRFAQPPKTPFNL